MERSISVNVAGSKNPGLCRQQSMRIENEFARGAFIEVGVSAWRVLEWNHRRIDSLCRLRPPVQNGHHQLPVIAHYRALPGREGVRFRPAQADADA